MFMDRAMLSRFSGLCGVPQEKHPGGVRTGTQLRTAVEKNGSLAHFLVTTIYHRSGTLARQIMEHLNSGSSRCFQPIIASEQVGTKATFSGPPHLLN